MASHWWTQRLLEIISLYLLHSHGYPTYCYIKPRISSDQRPCLVLALPRLPRLLRRIRGVESKMATFSIVIPTLGRSSSYEVCKESLYQQSNQDFEIIKVTEEGSLAALRNEGARRARGQYLIFIDDDVVCGVDWLEAMHRSFQRGYVGVSGPSIITHHFRKNRDCFKLPVWLFSREIPGTLSSWGQWSLEATK